MSHRAAVVGVGQTQYRRRHSGRNTAELVREAVVAALADAQMDLDGIGLVVGGVAPDALAGIDHIDMGSIARPGIPYFRVNTGGATGSSAFLAGLTWIAAGRCDAVLVVAVERMGHAVTAPKVFNSIFDPIYERDISLSTLSMVALRATMMIQKYGYTLEQWAGLAARNSELSLLNDTLESPRRFSAQDVLSSGVISWPIHKLEIGPVSEGACAMVIASEKRVGRRSAAWIRGASGLSDTYEMGSRISRPEGALVDVVTLRRCAAQAYRQAQIINPAKQLDMVEIHAACASSESMGYAPLGICAAADGPRFLDSIVDGTARIAVNPSAGAQAANPVSATAMIRIAECALQVRGQAGRRQVDGIRLAVATGQGGATQFSTAVVLGAEQA